jgi:hypothetical protein|tara:strand:+ start:1720 stop:1893 length:174 start_codon:yes stop_codon:yes gene_type:complete
LENGWLYQRKKHQSPKVEAGVTLHGNFMHQPLTLALVAVPPKGPIMYVATVDGMTVE